MSIGCNVSVAVKLCSHIKNRMAGGERGTEKEIQRNWDGQFLWISPRVYFCKEWARLYFGSIWCYALWFHCEWIHWACIPTVSPVSILDKAIWISSTPSTSACEQLTVVEALTVFMGDFDGCIVWVTMRVWYVGTSYHLLNLWSDAVPWHSQQWSPFASQKAFL